MERLKADHDMLLSDQHFLFGRTAPLIGCLMLIWVLPVFAQLPEESELERPSASLFWQLYDLGGESVFCGKPFGHGQQGLEIESAVPVPLLKAAAGCAGQSLAQCRGNVQFRVMEKDLHNLFPVLAEIRRKRGSLPFGELPGEAPTQAGCDFEVGAGKAEPRPQVRGDLARAIFHMMATYGIEIQATELALLLKWHRDDPPSPEEMSRNDRIEALIGTRNSFVDNPLMQPPKVPSKPQTRDLEQEKLRQEIQKLKSEVAWESSAWKILVALAPFLTALVAIATAYLTYRKYNQEAGIQKRKELRERRLESLRRFDENFTELVKNLGAGSAALRASASASLMRFLQPRFKEFHDHVFSVLVANLKVDNETVVRDLQTRAFEIAVRLKLQSPGLGLARLDLSRAHLARVDLEGLDFSKLALDIAKADLSRSNLTGARLPRSRGFNVDLKGARLSRTVLQEARLNEADCEKTLFHGANLVSATLKHANLQKAEFQQASLQSAHLENSFLNDAQFQEADVSDTFFKGAHFNKKALQSLLRTKNQSWRKAHFSVEICEELSELARQREKAEKKTPDGQVTHTPDH